MNRRNFLKLSGLAVMALLVQSVPFPGQLKALPPELSANGLLLRASPGGEIQTSTDAGQTWQLHTRLGSQYIVAGFFVDAAQRIHAQVAFQGHPFELVLTADNQYWMTV